MPLARRTASRHLSAPLWWGNLKQVNWSKCYIRYILDNKFDLNIFQWERYYDMIFRSWPWIVVSRSTKMISLKLSEWFQSYQQGLSPVLSRDAYVFSHVTMTMYQLALQHLSALNVTLIKNSKCSFGHETSRQSCAYVITSLLNDCL